MNSHDPTFTIHTEDGEIITGYIDAELAPASGKVTIFRDGDLVISTEGKMLNLDAPDGPP